LWAPKSKWCIDGDYFMLYRHFMISVNELFLIIKNNTQAYIIWLKKFASRSESVQFLTSKKSVFVSESAWYPIRSESDQQKKND
jgi:hypothetical protein